MRAGSGDGPLHASERYAYGHRIDAVVLAGTHQNPRRLVRGRNKAFLEMKDAPLVRHVVEALLQAVQIDHVFVVGPAGELERSLEGLSRVHCVMQEGKMVANGWAAIRAVEARQGHLSEERLRDRPSLLISCDLPLIVPEAIDDFVARSAAADRDDRRHNALCVGVAEDAGLSPFYSDDDRPGIDRPLVHVSEGLMRLANIYVVRPRRLRHTEFLQTGFNLRKAKDWRNVMKLAFSLFSQHGGWFAAWMTLRLQLAAMLARGGGKWYRKMRAGNTLARIERGVSTVLGGPVRVVVTPFGGLSLDVDDEEDFEVLSERYDEWMGVTRSTVPAAPATATARTR